MSSQRSGAEGLRSFMDFEVWCWGEDWVGFIIVDDRSSGEGGRSVWGIRAGKAGSKVFHYVAHGFLRVVSVCLLLLLLS